MKKEKKYGLSQIIQHPQGFEYQVEFLDETRSLNYSKLLWCRDTITKKPLKFD